MKMKDSEKPKAILLVCGIAGVFGLIVVRMNSLNAPAPQVAAVVEETLPDNQRAQTIFASNENTAIELAPDSPVTFINPFRRILPDPDGRSTPSTPTVRMTSQPEPLSSYYPKPPRELGSLPASSTPVFPAELPATVAEAVERGPELKLDGVLTGADPVAVLKVGSTTQVVGVGQTVDGYTVKAVTDSSVKLQKGKQTITLRLE
jgi:hypothetical protein